MEQIEASTVTKQFKRTFCEARLNELGKAVRFCLRERTVTPFRLVMGLINVMSTPKVETSNARSTPCARPTCNICEARLNEKAVRFCLRERTVRRFDW